MIAPVEQALRERLGDVVYGTDDETLERVVVGLLTEQSKTLAAGESCSGGLISKRITDVPDASHVFGLGVVAYSNDAKVRLLHVPEEMIAVHGAVSPEVARAMAEGARKAGAASLGVSVTGIAGPGGGSEAKPVGTVHIGLAWDGGSVSKQEMYLGRRADIAFRSAQSALALVRRFLISPQDSEFYGDSTP